MHGHYSDYHFSGDCQFLHIFVAESSMIIVDDHSHKFRKDMTTAGDAFKLIKIIQLVHHGYCNFCFWITNENKIGLKVIANNKRKLE